MAINKPSRRCHKVHLSYTEREFSGVQSDGQGASHAVVIELGDTLVAALAMFGVPMHQMLFGPPQHQRSELCRLVVSDMSKDVRLFIKRHSVKRPWQS